MQLCAIRSIWSCLPVLQYCIMAITGPSNDVTKWRIAGTMLPNGKLQKIGALTPSVPAQAPAAAASQAPGPAQATPLFTSFLKVPSPAALPPAPDAAAPTHSGPAPAPVPKPERPTADALAPSPAAVIGAPAAAAPAAAHANMTASVAALAAAVNGTAGNSTAAPVPVPAPAPSPGALMQPCSSVSIEHLTMLRYQIKCNLYCTPTFKFLQRLICRSLTYLSSSEVTPFCDQINAWDCTVVA